MSRQLILFLVHFTRFLPTNAVNLNKSVSDDNKTIVLLKFIERYPIKKWKENGFFREDYLNEIDEHWLIFLPPDKRNHIILACLYIIIMIIGLFGNLLVIILFLRYVFINYKHLFVRQKEYFACVAALLDYFA